jgi:hypothetical protein
MHSQRARRPSPKGGDADRQHLPYHREPPQVELLMEGALVPAQRDACVSDKHALVSTSVDRCALSIPSTHAPAQEFDQAVLPGLPIYMCVRSHVLNSILLLCSEANVAKQTRWSRSGIQFSYRQEVYLGHPWWFVSTMPVFRLGKLCWNMSISATSQGLTTSHSSSCRKRTLSPSPVIIRADHAR